jgi:hypothetical protein
MRILKPQGMGDLFNRFVASQESVFGNLQQVIVNVFLGGLARFSAQQIA